MIAMTELQFLCEAMTVAQRRRYKASFVYTTFRARFGRWPNDLLKQASPAEPSAEFLGWLQAHQQGAAVLLTKP